MLVGGIIENYKVITDKTAKIATMSIRCAAQHVRRERNPYTCRYNSMAEYLFCKQGVVGSSPTIGSSFSWVKLILVINYVFVCENRYVFKMLRCGIGRHDGFRSHFFMSQGSSPYWSTLARCTRERSSCSVSGHSNRKQTKLRRSLEQIKPKLEYSSVGQNNCLLGIKSQVRVLLSQHSRNNNLSTRGMGGYSDKLFVNPLW